MNSRFSIRDATLEDINSIGFLAQQIWPSTYEAILKPGQVGYMLNLIYSPSALRRQIMEESHHFLILEEDEEPKGFADYSRIVEPGICKLHKLYIMPGRQGKGLGKAILDFIGAEIRTRGARVLQLNCNRDNIIARDFYKRMGFSVIGEEDIDIGQGYFMNDFIMEKLI